MPRSARGHHLDLAEGAKIVFADLHFIEKYFSGIGGKTAQHGVTHRPRLLVNLLEHEMLEAALFREDGIPGDMLHPPAHRVRLKIGEVRATRGEHGNVAVGQKQQVAGVVQNGRDIAGHEVFVFTQADDRRRSLANGYNLIEIARRNNGKGKDSGELAYSLSHGVFQTGRPVIQVFLDKVSNHLSVGFSGEAMPFAGQSLLQLEIVLNDAVMHHHHRTVAVLVRMGVLHRRSAMGGPTRVSDAISAVHRILADHLFQIAQFAGGTAYLERACLDHGETGRVVTAVLQPLQSFEQHGHHALVANVADDS